MAIEAGTRIGPYEIQSAIGAGGKGEVNKATDTRLDRTMSLTPAREALGDSMDAPRPGGRRRHE
jgi:hypothetical protein